MPNNPENNRNTTSVSTQKGEPTKIEIRDHITRTDVRAEKDKIFLFGDNLAGKGYGGQAKEMRGEVNSVGIPTKKAPSNDPKSFFTDQEFDSNKKAIDEAFQKIPPGKTIVIPKAGLGTGLAQLQEKAPKTFAYLNEKLTNIGFLNPGQETTKNRLPKADSADKVILQNSTAEAPTAKRLLDLNNIQTASLRGLSPTEKEMEALRIDAKLALTDYAERLRHDYQTNRDNFRDGLRILSDSLEKGEQISITCSCRSNNSLCHADVVKMAVEKVNAQVKNTSIIKDRRESPISIQENSKTSPVKQTRYLNPRTQKAINEILSISENDRALEKINQTDGRNRSEQASYLGKLSPFIRDLYERGANIVDGNLIVPQEKLTDSQPLTVTTEAHAVERISKILEDETRAKELAPVVVEYGHKIAGVTADGETKLKVFGWIYDSLEGKSVSLLNENGEKPDFNETLEKIRGLAEEMHSLEPLDKTEFVPLSEIEKNYSADSLIEMSGDVLNPGEIYEEAINPEFNEQSFELETNEKIKTEGFERLDLMTDMPRIPADYSEDEIIQLINETLPEIDRQLENGIPQKEILAPFNEAIRQSAHNDAQKRLEFIYQKQKHHQKASQSNGKDREINQNLNRQLANIVLLHQNVIELQSPTEYLQAEKEAIKTFYRRQKQEVGSLLTRIDEVRENHSGTSEKGDEIPLKKELNKTREAQPNFAFKLENSTEIVVGTPSEETVQKRNFVLSYTNYQLQKPETRLRSQNERYRDFAARLETAASRDEVMKNSAEIRSENAALGFRWKDVSPPEREKLVPPLTNREMQFLFTESSPAHYTGEMTATRLSYAHSGASRRALAQSLLKGEISPSPEAQKLIESLESRLQRREIKDSLLATKHFCLSIKTPNERLKYKNGFDHQEIYRKLPPQEKDFVYARATQQKENLEYQHAFKKEQEKKRAEINRADQSKPEMSQTEKDFHLESLFYQALVLGDQIESKPLRQQEISQHEVQAVTLLLVNQPAERLEKIAGVLNKSDQPEKQKIGELLQTFAHAEISQSENKTTVTIKLPENNLVSTETYRELLEKFYPDNRAENEKYKFENLSEKAISGAREKGQDETLQNLRDEIKGNVYQTDGNGKVIETSASVLEKLDKITRLQSEARTAKAVNERMTIKYAARANAKMQDPNQEIPSMIDQRKIISAAFGLKSADIVSNKTNDQFLALVQKEITISDLNKFTANEKLLSELKAGIKNEFSEISESLKILEENKLQPAKTIEKTEKDPGSSPKIPNQETMENQPASLRIFEKELEKAERGLLQISLTEKLNAEIDQDKNLDPKTVFSEDERATIKAKAIEMVKEKLEPKELNADNRKISPEASRQAFATYKELTRAIQVFQTGDNQSKITEAFSKLDGEAVKLNQLRQDYQLNEKMALLRDGIKIDLIDFLKKNQASKPNTFEAEINRILLTNLYKSDFVKPGEDEKTFGILSRQIAEKIEAKKIFAPHDKVLSTASRELAVSAKSPYSPQNDQTKTSILEKAKDAPYFTR